MLETNWAILQSNFRCKSWLHLLCSGKAKWMWTILKSRWPLCCWEGYPGKSYVFLEPWQISVKFGFIHYELYVPKSLRRSISFIIYLDTQFGAQIYSPLARKIWKTHFSIWPVNMCPSDPISGKLSRKKTPNIGLIVGNFFKQNSQLTPTGKISSLKLTWHSHSPWKLVVRRGSLPFGEVVCPFSGDDAC